MWWFKKKKQKELNLDEYPDFWKAYILLNQQPQAEALDEKLFVVLDTETTGFDYKRDRILSFGAVKVQNNNVLIEDSIEFYIAQDHYDSSTAPIHGILQSESHQQMSELDAIKVILSYLSNCIIVAHHAAFDIKMINAALKRNGMPELLNKVIDTSSLHSHLVLKTPTSNPNRKYSLDELAAKFDVSTHDRHTALGDAYITALIFLKIASHLKENDKKELYS